MRAKASPVSGAVYGHHIGGRIACGLPGHGGGGVGLSQGHADQLGEGRLMAGSATPPVFDEGDVAASGR